MCVMGVNGCYMENDAGRIIKFAKRLEKLDFYAGFEDRVTKYYGSDTWSELFGDEMAEARTDKQKALA